MESLHKKYQDQLDSLKVEIQNSPILTQYLDEEEDEFYQALRLEFEPKIQSIYQDVADSNPLQLVALENEIIDEKFEGLYAARILGYSVLRGAINDNCKYYIPQNHFKDILIAIANSANFDIIKQRIGQAIQIGFALSSDIWITNTIDTLINKKVKLFLLSQKMEKYRDIRSRRTSYVRFTKQFESLNFQSADFPTNKSELKVFAPGLKNFLLYRALHEYDNQGLLKHIINLMENHTLADQDEFLEIVMIIGMFYDLKAKEAKVLFDAFNAIRSKRNDMETKFFTELRDFYESDMPIDVPAEKRLIASVDKSKKDEVSKYLSLLDQVHGKGYIHEESIEAIRHYYYQHEGLSLNNECLRQVIVRQYHNFMSNLLPSEYNGYLEITKTITQYIGIFSNQKFNQKIKEISLSYIRKLLKYYPDKRGRDYPDIKKFVTTTFRDLNFMKDKELVELFKTKRKKKVV